MNRTAFIAIAAVAGLSLSAAGQTAQELKIKQLSTFSAPTALRNPFWTIGFQKQALRQTAVVAKPGAAVPEAAIKAELFTVSSISTGARPVAIINGKICEEGELIAIPGAGPKAMAQVSKIGDGAVTLRYLNQSVMVGLRGLRR